MILKCHNIVKYFYVRDGSAIVRAVDGASLSIEKGSSFGLVGESGSGKTTLGKIVLGLILPDSGKVELHVSHSQVIFQDPFGSLDPKMKVGDIIAEGLVAGRKAIRNTQYAIRNKVARSLDMVRLPEAAVSKYPHEFSGGERQRIAIARAIITEPEFIVCDEPVSSLDVTVQLDILLLLKDINKKLGISYLFISHDLRVIKFMCDKVAVMKEGRIVEEGRTEEIYSNPKDPYTRQLLYSSREISF